MRRAAASWVMIAASCLFITSAGAENAISQDSVKAAFLSRFPSFVQWPASSFSDARAPLRLCIVGDGSFAPLLEQAAARQMADTRGMEVRRLPNSLGARDCHVLFISGGNVDETMRAVRGRPVLTVTDSATGGARGIVHFTIVQDRVRFYIDDAQAAEAGLFISSRLLALAVSVRRRPE